MRVALVGPELEENLALRYLHAAVVAAGHEAEIFDFHSGLQIDPLAKRIAAWQPDVIGLSMVFTARARQFIGLAQAVRDLGWRGHVTAGGHFASFHAAELLREFPAIDTIIHGEAEESLVELLAHIDAPTAVEGVSGRDEGGAGRTILAKPRRNIADLDRRPWPTRPDTFFDYLGQPIANMLSSRGCYANCDFCSISAWHRHSGGPAALRFRQRRPECVAAEMAMLYHEHSVRIFNFHDDNFFLPDRAAMADRVNDLLGRLRALGVGGAQGSGRGAHRIAIQVKARPSDIHPDTLALLMRLGLFRVFLGVENAAVDGLRHLGRGVDREQNHAALALLAKANLHVCFNLLLFEPDCTEADVRENVQFMRTYATFPLNFCRTEVYSGTPLQARLAEQGRLLGDYFGFHYLIADERMQRAFEMFREVFTPRNFACDGVIHEGMRVDYYWHILRHFRADRAKAAGSLGGRVKAAVRELNTNNADLMDRILDLATGASEAECTRQVADLSRQRDEFDTKIRAEFEPLLVEIVKAATRPASKSLLGRAAKAAAAAGLMAAVAGSANSQVVVDPVPPPHNPPATQPVGPIRVIRLEPHMSEMAPRPHFPPPPPTSQPAAGATSQPGSTSQPDFGPVLGAAGVKPIQEYFNGPGMSLLYPPTIKYAALGKTVLIRLAVNSSGVVKRVEVMFPRDSIRPELKRELEEALLNVEIPDVTRAGSAAISVKLTTPKPRLGPPHMFEMAPAPVPRD